MEPPAASQPNNNYDFILNPEKPQKRGLMGGIGGDSFVVKILFLVGGAVLIMIVLSLVINMFFGGRTSVDTYVSLAQTEEEIVRLSGQGKDATDQQIKNAAMNTGLIVKSHQVAWLSFLGQRGREVKSDELKLKRDTTADARLNTAKQASLFDSTYVNLMRSELTDYAKALKTAYDGGAGTTQKATLSEQYKNVTLLLKQWPEASVSSN